MIPLRSTVAFGVAFLLQVPATSRAEVPMAATRAMLAQCPGSRAIVEGERLVALYGVPLATDADANTNTDAFVEAFLAERGDALGVDDVVLILADKINIRNDKFTVYTYTQRIEDLPVHGSVVKIPVLLGTTEKIGYVGNAAC